MPAPTDNHILKLLADAKSLQPEARQLFSKVRTPLILAAIGITFSIGSTGLLMGALTTGLASYMMSRGMEMVPAMNVGFTTVSLVFLTGGLILSTVTIRTIIKNLGNSQ